MELLKGKPVADLISQHIEQNVEHLLDNGIVPTLGILRVGSNESDIAYENSAEKKAKSLGIFVEKFIMDENSREEDVIDVIKFINDNKNIHGLLMFRPLPKHMNEDRVRNHLKAEKDIDGITDGSLAGIFTGGGTGFPPCTAEAAMTILEHYGVDVAGKKVVVIGRSLVIGKPVAMMLMEKNATVTICHSRTAPEDLKKYCQDADIIVTATGKIGTLTAEHVNGKQIIVDVGINFNEEGKMCGDADFAGIEAAEGAAAMTPVPGGVGGVTTVLLLHHVIAAAMGSLQNQ